MCILIHMSDVLIGMSGDSYSGAVTAFTYLILVLVQYHSFDLRKLLDERVQYDGSGSTEQWRRESKRSAGRNLHLMGNSGSVRCLT